MAPADHPLDRIIWEALTTQHAGLAQGDALARRYPAEIAAFAAVREPSMAAFAELARLVPADDVVATFTVEPLEPPAPLVVVQRESVDQMVGPPAGPPRGDLAVIPLGDADVADMMALVTLTEPGPFKVRTHELGGFVGIRHAGELIAMAGRRMHLDGFTEISAVCVHPAWRGHGYAAELARIVADGIRAMGETPFLHVRSGNRSAIALYHKLGFAHRRTLHLAVIGRATLAP